MIVWTVQPRAALDRIASGGTFRCRPELSYNLSKADSLQGPYRWLMERMREKIGPEPAGVVSPIWAWHTWNFRRECPDTESAAFLKRTEEKVLLTLDIPENALVLTDFDGWQFVMMNAYVSAEATKEAYEALEKRLDSLTGEALREAVLASRENVFLTDPVNNEYLIRGRYIQATFWEVRAGYIRDQKILPPNG